MKNLLFALVFMLLPLPVFAAGQDEVKIVSVEARQLKALGERLVYSIKVDVQNLGDRSNIFVNVVGKDANGFQIALVPVFGFFEAGQTKSLTAQTLFNPANGEIATWEAASFGK